MNLESGKMEIKLIIIAPLVVLGAWACYKVVTSTTWDESIEVGKCPEIKERPSKLYRTDNGTKENYIDARIIISNEKFEQ
jgi:hypothetical protein